MCVTIVLFENHYSRAHRLAFRGKVTFLGDEHLYWGQICLGHYLLHSWLILVVQRTGFDVLRNQPTPNLWDVIPRV